MAKERVIEVAKATDIELAQILIESYGMLMKIEQQITLVRQEVGQRQLKLNESKKKEK